MPLPTNMKNNPESIYTKLQRLGQMIEEARLTKMRRNFQWRGADVRITDDPNFVKSERHWLDHDVVICTVYTKELSWLFVQLRDLFAGHLDFRNKYGFYGELAQSALRYLEKGGSEADDFRPLLREVLVAAYDFCATIEETGEIPPNSTIVIHSRDASGQQQRIEL